MKFYKLIFAFFLSTLLHAQYDLTTVGNDPAATNSSGMWIVNNASAAKIQGTFYLLEDWVSKGYLTRIDGKVVTVLGLNYDTKSATGFCLHTLQAACAIFTITLTN